MNKTIRCFALAAVAALLPSFVSAQAKLEGVWDGAMHAMGHDVEIHVTFAPADQTLKATISIPAQTTATLPLANVRAEGTSVHFELVAVGGPVAVFDGTLNGETISGSMTQGPVKGTFELARHKDVRAAAAAPAEPPPPYKQEEVTITNGSITLAGTLTVPPTPGRHPAVVLITGSGAQNRDEDLFGFKMFRIIADHLTRQGIAVLRCDDRGIGGSSGAVNDSTSEDFATDVAADIAFLKSRPDIDPKHIGLVGHSEGGLIAPMVAARSPEVAFIALMSGPALDGEKIILAQGERSAKAAGAPDAALAKQAEMQRRNFELVRKGQVDQIEKEANDLLQKQLAALPAEQRPTAEAMGSQRLKDEMTRLRGKWFRFFLDYDPLPALEKVRCPVLALFGELDMQVPVDLNKPLMEQAFARSGNRAATIKVLPKANHLFQEAKTGASTEYQLLKKEFVPDLLPTLSGWITAQVKGS